MEPFRLPRSEPTFCNQIFIISTRVFWFWLATHGAEECLVGLPKCVPCHGKHRQSTSHVLNAFVTSHKRNEPLLLAANRFGVDP
jgi:hypothetical protein